MNSMFGKAAGAAGAGVGTSDMSSRRRGPGLELKLIQGRRLNGLGGLPVRGEGEQPARARAEEGGDPIT